MAKKAAFNYKSYLKILGLITIVLGLGVVIGSICLGASNADVTKLGFDVAEAREKGASDEAIRWVIASFGIVSGLFSVFEGWLMRRAAKTPKKSTLLLVLLVLSVISGVSSILSTKQGSSAVAGAVINLAVDVLAVMSVVQIRREVNE